MKEKRLKLKANVVENRCHWSYMHFREYFKKNLNFKHQNLTSNTNGITLISLIITIIVMLILVGVTVNVAINGGLFKTSKNATAETQYEADKESLLSAVIGALNSSAEVDFKKLDSNLPEGFKGSEGEYTSKAGNTLYVDQYGNITIPVSPQIIIGEEIVTLTPENVGQYLGKVVINYKNNYNTTTTEKITIDSKEYTVSTKYRLYYVDFENKYKDGIGTIYLKADCTTNSGYPIPTMDSISSPTNDIKIKNLNPELYKEETPPSESNINIKAIKWITYTKNWEGLKKNLSNEIKENDINYIVGAPSLEMMMDSYNIFYGVANKELNTSILDKDSPRVKLFYKYPYDDKKFGYGVGPSNNSLAQDGYYTCTSNYSVKSDSAIDSMYYPGDNQYYWLASPSGNDPGYVMFVYYDNGGCVYYHGYNNYHAFCPLVSLKSSVQLKLEK